MNLLDRLYSIYDSVTKKYGVYKMEITGVHSLMGRGGDVISHSERITVQS